MMARQPSVPNFIAIQRHPFIQCSSGFPVQFTSGFDPVFIQLSSNFHPAFI
ncbi:hypothetical protein HM1_1191 [Heliomicrobium modesticaldum Ice1]|uniref:Uncharacterized protein n=1 Tax=Heliobacterium modesticaldum (strain ATCC 51547 / Ice1) TaxID=498761 RepID=B0THE5_HELMI|nr:hypothetical protein HM1_1191 [Heliomicrobium modesticaldum Ice1]